MNNLVDGFAFGIIKVSHPYPCVRPGPGCGHQLRFFPVDVGGRVFMPLMVVGHKGCCPEEAGALFRILDILGF